MIVEDHRSIVSIQGMRLGKQKKKTALKKMSSTGELAGECCTDLVQGNIYVARRK